MGACAALVTIILFFCDDELNALDSPICLLSPLTFGSEGSSALSYLQCSILYPQCPPGLLACANLSLTTTLRLVLDMVVHRDGKDLQGGAQAM